SHLLRQLAAERINTTEHRDAELTHLCRICAFPSSPSSSPFSRRRQAAPADQRRSLIRPRRRRILRRPISIVNVPNQTSWRTFCSSSLSSPPTLTLGREQQQKAAKRRGCCRQLQKKKRVT